MRRPMLSFFSKMCLSCALFVFSFLLLSFNEASAKEQYRIQIYTSRAGTSVHVLGVALAELINKNSTWLKASIVEALNPESNIKRVTTNEKLRKTVIFHCHEAAHYVAMQGFPLFKDVDYDFSKLRYVFLIGAVLDPLITLDSEIKTVKDLRGKKVVVYSRPTPNPQQEMLNYILKSVGLSKDEIKYEYMHFKPRCTALKDGLVDVVGIGGFMIKYPDEWMPDPFALETLTTRQAYYISYDAKVLKDMFRDTGIPYFPATIPPNTFPNQTEPWIVPTKYMQWAVTDEMPDEVVEEILRLVYANTKVFPEYIAAGKNITPKTMGMMGGNLQYYHPVSLKFYKEKGVPIGTFK